MRPFMRTMMVLWLILWCGFDRERSALPALVIKRKRRAGASRKKFSAVRTHIGPSRVSTQDGFGWKRDANDKECGPDHKCHNAGCDIADDDTVTYQAAPETDPRGHESVPRPLLTSAVALPGCQHNQQAYQEQGDPEEFFRYDIELSRFGAVGQEIAMALASIC